MEVNISTERLKIPPISRSNTTLPQFSRVAQSNEPTASRKPHLRSLHHHHQKHSHRHPRDVVQSAIQLHPPYSFGESLKQGSRSATPSRDPSTYGGSRRGSLVQLDNNEDNEISPKLVRSEDVVRERHKTHHREQELRASFLSLSEQSLEITSRLDDTYCSINEKIIKLRAAVTGLQELSASTRKLQSSFRSDIAGVQEEIQTQIEGFEGFREQRKQIEKLETRLKSGKAKADILNTRLENARQRVVAREKIEGQWQAKMSKRLRIFWGVLGTLFLLVTVLMCIHYIGDRSVGSTLNLTKPSDQVIDFDHISIPSPVKEILSSVYASTTNPSSFSTGLPLDDDTSDGVDQRLRILDEL